MNTLFVAEAREAAAFLEEAYEATLSPDPLPNPLSRPATPVEECQPGIVPVPVADVPPPNVIVAPAIAEIRPMPRPDHLPQHGYHICYRNPNGSFSPLLYKKANAFVPRSDV